MKPQDVFIGVRDLLAVLIPGAILLILLPIDVMPLLARRLSVGAEPDATVLTLAFLLTAMATGTLLSALSSLADDSVDDLIKKRIKAARLAPDQNEAAWKLSHVALIAGRLERRLVPDFEMIDDDRKPWSTRSFWWNYLRLNCPVAIAELDRVEGMQKQARSLWVVLVLLALLSLLSIISQAYGFAALSGRSIVQEALAVTLFGLGSVLCWTSYVSYRVRFSRRLYELAIISDLSRCRGVFRDGPDA